MKSLPLAAGAVLAGLWTIPPAGGAKPIDSSLFVAGGADLKGIALEQVVDAPPAAVFRAWTTSEGVKAFLGVDSAIDLRVGGSFELYFGPNEPEGSRGAEGCQVLAYLPDRMLAFSWNAPPKLPDERAKRSWIVLLFQPEGEGRTRVSLNHIGFGEGGRWSEVRKYFEKAWPNVLAALASHFRKG